MNVRQQQDESLGELVGQLASDFGALVRDELQLARVEVKEDAKRVGRASGMLGAAALAGFLTILTLTLAAAWGLSEAVPEGVAFLITAVVWGIVGTVLLTVGRQRLREANIKPEQTIETMQENIQWAKQQKS